MLWTTMIFIQTDYSFTLLKEHGFLLISGIVQETIKGDCSHCQRPHVVPVDPDSGQSEKIWEY